MEATRLFALAGALSAGPASAQVTLTEWTSEAGLTAIHQPDEEGIPDFQGWMTGGAAVGDFNNDGCQDVFWVAGGLIPDKLFINNCDGTGTFTDQAAAWGLDVLHCGNGAAVGDYNNDGLPDIYVTSFGLPGREGSSPGSHRLYRNDGGSFTEVAALAGVNYSCPEGTGNAAGYGSAFGDYDLDGFLDLFVTSWWEACDGNRLYHNDGDGTFTDVTEAALGTAIDGVWGFQPAFVDMNGDRYPELLLTADFSTSRYFVNNADGTFTDMTAASGTGLDEHGMGQTVADLDHNLLFDWYVTSIKGDSGLTGNKLYMNQGSHAYVETAAAAGVDDGAWGWATIAIDLDHDTWTDLLEVNGRPSEPWSPAPARLFYNDGGGASFSEIALASGFVHTDEGRGLVYLDAENDGDLDVIITTYLGPLTYFRNDTNGGSWLRIAFDTSANPLLAPDGFGTRVVATVGEQSYCRFMSSSPSYLSTSELTVHFGLGSAATVDELRVEWARGYVTIMNDVEVNQHLTIAAPGLGDLDADGDVDINDFLALIAAWGACADPPEPCLADLDNDGSVGLDDFQLILANWG